MVQTQKISQQQFAEIIESLEVSDSCNLGDVAVFVGTHESRKKIVLSSAGGACGLINLD